MSPTTSVDKHGKCVLCRYPLSILPRTEDSLKEFLQKRWSEKEETLKEYNTTGNFLHGEILKRNSASEIYVALIFWTVLPFLVGYLLLTHAVFRYIVVAHTVMLVVINLFAVGFPDLEVGVYNIKRKLCRKLDFT